MSDIVSGTVLILVAVVYFLGARELPSGPSFFPHILSAVLAALATFIIVRGIRESSRIEHVPVVRPAALTLLTIAYALVFVPAGFLLSTLGYTVAVVLLLERRGWGWLFVPVATTAFLYAAFVVGLGVTLP